MKKKILAVVLAAACILLVFSVSAFVKRPETTVTAVKLENKSPLEARFLNMLNHNFVYNDDFASYDNIVTGCVISLLSSKEDDYINETYVKGFAKDMYGLNIVSFGEQNPAHAKEGYIYVTPRGYTSYTHGNLEITENEDGTYTVVSEVQVRPHDDGEYTATAVSMFVPNEESPFGFILSRSTITKDAVAF